MLYKVTWLIAAAAPVVGSRPGAGSNRMPILIESFAIAGVAGRHINSNNEITKLLHSTVSFLFICTFLRFGIVNGSKMSRASQHDAADTASLGLFSPRNIHAVTITYWPHLTRRMSWGVTR
jgi:hypothetical protein